MSTRELYIGLMSGTSIDGIDLALVDMNSGIPKRLAHETFAYSSDLADELHQLCQSGADEIERMGAADIKLAKAFANAVKQTLAQHNLSPNDIIAIGSHGQTIRHRPNSDYPFTLQIGDPNTLAVETGIDVVSDFRRKDIALGGQGAPLVPAFHNAVFSSDTSNRAIVNIGGIANITWLPKGQDPIVGFDTGPGNRLMDAWCTTHTGKPFDSNGNWARQGQVDSELLQQLLSHPYLAQSFPKSTGRELFNLDWLEQQLSNAGKPNTSVDIQRTLLEFTAESISLHLTQLAELEEVFICGGGAENTFLMDRLQQLLAPIKVSSTNSLNIPPDTVEAMAFAWLAYAFKNNIPGNIPSVTGASREALLGGLYPAR
ncbi:anhydro-N-acetylmuramic acid kinase [Paraneptunicella aestuarii]|uniref:anhydro-N-acetylmuramic acid kinase n=1 Tax=Paraneptunicella aestuarii TaxID=2831148 RepID=UPI001E404662|nr:anhydro-N-acetylmuramic acid kinase [Paraneptunicella aestuarii]UAA39365.1 anhydro-N-acetylmuramic acid kinase [Paraneptunicella aestuarii]